MSHLRAHRNLFNVDCNYLFHSHKANKPGRKGESWFRATSIHRYVDLLADNGADTILINPNGQVAWYPSKVMPRVWDGCQRGDKKFFYGRIPGQQMSLQQMAHSNSHFGGCCCGETVRCTALRRNSNSSRHSQRRPAKHHAPY
jgi:hypothetical protein